MLAFSITRSRPAACIPTFQDHDDGFWALLSQFFLQLSSLFYTVVPLVRDRYLPVRRFWLNACIVLGVVATVVAPMVYGVSWQASTVASYISGVAGLVASAQLATSIQLARTEADLGRGRHK